MQVNTEGSNLHAMQQHALKRTPLKDTLTHEKLDLLDGKILAETSTVLNGISASPLGRIESDADAQLLIRLVFKHRVTVESVSLVSSSSSAARPKEVRFFADRPTLDFSDVDHAAPAKVADLEISHAVALAGTKFARISSLEIFVQSNVADEPQTLIDKLIVSGFLVDHYIS